MASSRRHRSDKYNIDNNEDDDYVVDCCSVFQVTKKAPNTNNINASFRHMNMPPVPSLADAARSLHPPSIAKANNSHSRGVIDVEDGDSIVYRGSGRRSERNGESYGARGHGRRSRRGSRRSGGGGGSWCNSKMKFVILASLALIVTHLGAIMIGAVIGRARMSKVDNENRGGENNENGYIPGDEQEENDGISGENDDIESYLNAGDEDCEEAEIDIVMALDGKSGKMEKSKGADELSRERTSQKSRPGGKWDEDNESKSKLGGKSGKAGPSAVPMNEFSGVVYFSYGGIGSMPLEDTAFVEGEFDDGGKLRRRQLRGATTAFTARALPEGKKKRNVNGMRRLQSNSKCGKGLKSKGSKATPNSNGTASDSNTAVQASPFEPFFAALVSDAPTYSPTPSSPTATEQKAYLPTMTPSTPFSTAIFWENFALPAVPTVTEPLIAAAPTIPPMGTPLPSTYLPTEPPPTSHPTTLPDATPVPTMDLPTTPSPTSPLTPRPTTPSPTSTLTSTPTPPRIKLSRPTLATDVCSVGEGSCLCGECVEECENGPIDSTHCNHFCQYANDAASAPPLILYLAPRDGYAGDILVEFQSEGSNCGTTASLTASGVYIIWKPDNDGNCNGNSKLDPNIYIKRNNDSDEEAVNVRTSCSSALYVGQMIDEKYEVVGFCNDDGTCGIVPPL